MLLNMENQQKVSNVINVVTLIVHVQPTSAQYSYRGYLSEVKQQIGDMAVNGSGIRDTARVLKIGPTTVIEQLKKRSRSRTS